VPAVPDPVESTGASITVRDLTDECVVHSEARGRSPRALHDARRPVETVIFPESGGMQVADPTPRDLDKRQREPATGEGHDRPLTAMKFRRHDRGSCRELSGSSERRHHADGRSTRRQY